MKTLFSFGCSFTEEFKEIQKFITPNTRIDYINQCFNGEAPESYPTILAKKLGFNVKNYAGVGGYFNPINNTYEGNCNQSIINNISHYCHEFKKDDIVIIEWTYVERFKWANELGKAMVTITPNFLPETNIADYPNFINNQTAEDIFINRMNTLWIDELFFQQKLITQLIQNVKANVFFWTMDNNLINHKRKEIQENTNYLLSDILKDDDYIKIFNNNGAKTIIEETDGKIKDWHYGVSGHKVQAELFHDYIVKYIN